VIVNNRRPVWIPVRVLDAAGHVLPDTGVRFQWASGANIPVSAVGELTCARSGDATVRATLGRLATEAVVRCRPVETVRIAGPIQFMLGDTARQLPIAVLGPDGRPVDLLEGQVWIEDSSVATVEGLRVRPRAPGATLLAVTIGNRDGAAGVHVYERASTLDGLRQERRLLAVPLRLTPGDMRRWHLPAGEWMLTMWPEEDEGRGLRLRLEGANCVRSRISKRRYQCLVRDEASVIVYAPWQAAPSSELIGTLAVMPTGPPTGSTSRGTLAATARAP
jgi:hypothetical protein